MAVSLIYDFSMRTFVLLLLWTAFVASLQMSWQIFLLLLPSGLFIFGVVIYGNFISEGVFVEIAELFKGWGKVGKTFHHVLCKGWVTVHVQTSLSLTWRELLGSEAVASVWYHVSTVFLTKWNYKGLTGWLENLEGFREVEAVNIDGWWTLTIVIIRQTFWQNLVVSSLDRYF